MARFRPTVRQKGMTLIEVMMAVSVLAFSFSVVYGSLVTMYVLGRTNEDRVRAITAAAALIEEIQAMDINRIATFTPNTTGLLLPGVEHWATVEFVVPEGESFDTVSIPLSDMSVSDLPNPVEVRLTVNWLDKDGRAFQYKVSSMKAR